MNYLHKILPVLIKLVTSFCILVVQLILIQPAQAESNPAQTQPVVWKRIANDLESTDIQVPEKFFTAQIKLFRTKLTHYRLGIVRAEDFGHRTMSVLELCRASGALFGINANFFDPDNQALGLVISHGTTYRKLQLGGQTLTGIFFATNKNKIKIVSRNDFNPSSVSEAVQAGPRLVVAGQVVSELDRSFSYARRSGVCIDQQQRLIIFSAANGLLGASFAQLQSALTKKNVRCVDALNFDGGGSAQLYMSRYLPGRAQNTEEISIPGHDNVPVILALFAR